MSVAFPPEMPAAPAPPETSVPPVPTYPPPPTPTHSAPPSDPGPPPTVALPASTGGPARGPGRTGAAGGLILIALGVLALFGTWFPGRGAWIFLGLGVAFLAARLLTSRYGFAVPAGILLGFGSFIWFTETGFVNGPAAGGLFF